MIAYKLFRRRHNGTLGPLFINRKQIVIPGIVYDAESHKTKGFAFRPGWHCCAKPCTPHLTENGRVWARVEISDYSTHIRPSRQGGLWYTANKLRVLDILENII